MHTDVQSVDSNTDLPFGHKVLFTEGAPKPGKNYSQARAVDFGLGKIIFIAGQTGNEPVADTVVEGGIVPQTRQALENIKAILESEQSSLADVTLVTVYLTDMKNDKEGFEKAYGEYFPSVKPSRALVEVSEIPLVNENTIVEIQVIAVSFKKNNS